MRRNLSKADRWVRAVVSRCPLYRIYGFSSIGGLHREPSRCLIDVDDSCS